MSEDFHLSFFHVLRMKALIQLMVAPIRKEDHGDKPIPTYVYLAIWRKGKYCRAVRKVSIFKLLSSLKSKTRLSRFESCSCPERFSFQWPTAYGRNPSVMSGPSRTYLLTDELEENDILRDNHGW